MGGLDASVGIAENYRRFAQRDVVARSSAYQELALAVARDGTVIDFLATLPAGKQQPNLLFAAARLILGDTPGEQSLRHLVDQRTDELATVMRRRRTQTNEVGRCATLLPALSRLPQPLALIEVGASAGLTLLPDRYSYDYDGHLVRGTDPSAPTLTCHVTGPVPLPDAVPSILWRAGLDLNPLDVASDDDVAWLECLVWPGQPERRDRLRRAAASARRDPPPVHRGDLIDDLPALVARVPTEAATIVVFHSAVLAYLEPPRRAAFADLVADLGVHWMSNEAPGVLPITSDQGSQGFRLVENGRDVVADTDPHGASLHWLD